MALLGLHRIGFSFGDQNLLEDATLQIEAGERLGLLGRNGAGKSTLLRLISGELEPDRGEIVRQPGLRVARLLQEVPAGLAGTVLDAVSAGVGAAAELLAEYHRVSHELAQQPSATLSVELDRVQRELEAAGGWEAHLRVERILSQTSLDPDADFADLSSGMKRRVLFAQALAGSPDLLLLDEPTNHLDIDTIGWLESFLARFASTLVFVTHDRVFLQNLATRILDIDRARLTSWNCDYETYLKRKQVALEAEVRQQALFDRRLAAEEVWIRQGIKARRTRNEGRVRALKKMRTERTERRAQAGSVRMLAQEAEKTGRLVIRAREISFSYGSSPIFQQFSALISRGDRIGIVGPNGSGKTTLLRTLLGELRPDEGSVRHGTNIQVAYFDQLREQLDEGKTVQENVGDGSDKVSVNGRTRHILGYLQDFLFPPARARTVVRFLSGGEKNRVLLAKLFTRPANVLVLDEPTNDLDMETLELLEEFLLDYQGTVLLVSHDRAFLNNVVTSTFAFEGGATLGEYAGGYDDWLRQRKPVQSRTGAPAEQPERRGPKRRDALPSTSSTPPKRRKLSYNDQRELDRLPQRIEQLEARQRQLHASMADPEFYKQEGSEIAGAKAKLDALEQELLAVFGRWEELEG